MGVAEVKNDGSILVKELHILKQISDWASCEITKDGFLQYDRMMEERKLEPHQYGRVWLHTHPGKSATPSKTDWENFRRFQDYGWALMLILASDWTATGHLWIRDSYSAVGSVVPVDVALVLDPPWLIQEDDWLKDLKLVEEPAPRPTLYRKDKKSRKQTGKKKSVKDPESFVSWFDGKEFQRQKLKDIPTSDGGSSDFDDVREYLNLFEESAAPQEIPDESSDTTAAETSDPDDKRLIRLTHSMGLNVPSDSLVDEETFAEFQGMALLLREEGIELTSWGLDTEEDL